MTGQMMIRKMQKTGVLADLNGMKRPGIYPARTASFVFTRACSGVLRTTKVYGRATCGAKLRRAT
jgi:hypothetical protein